MASNAPQTKESSLFRSSSFANWSPNEPRGSLRQPRECQYHHRRQGRAQSSEAGGQPRVNSICKSPHCALRPIARCNEQYCWAGAGERKCNFPGSGEVWVPWHHRRFQLLLLRTVLQQNFDLRHLLCSDLPVAAARSLTNAKGRSSVRLGQGGVRVSDAFGKRSHQRDTLRSQLQRGGWRSLLLKCWRRRLGCSSVGWQTAEP